MTQMTAASAKLIGDPRTPLTDQWLADVGFRWHQMDRQPSKHWVLWLGLAIADHNISMSDLGIELAGNRFVNRYDRLVDHEKYFCWLRSDSAHRYSRFLHIRHLRTRGELLDMIYGLTGVHFDPANCWYGSLVTPEMAARNRIEHDRLDMRMARDGHPHNDLEKDDTAGRAMIEHKVAFIRKEDAVGCRP